MTTLPILGWKRPWFSSTVQGELYFTKDLKSETPATVGKMLLKHLPQLGKILNSQDSFLVNLRGTSQGSHPGELLATARGKLSPAASDESDEESQPVGVQFAIRTEFESFLPSKEIRYHRIVEASEELREQEPWLNFERLFAMENLELSAFSIQLEFLKQRSFGDFLGLAPVLFRELSIDCDGLKLSVKAIENGLKEKIPPFADWDLAHQLQKLHPATSSGLN